MSENSKPLNHGSLADVAFQEIRRRIIELQIKPGQHLKLDAMARELGISLTPLREALNRLTQQGLVRVETYRGFRVEPLLGVEQLERLGKVRYLLENEALQNFAYNAGSPEFAALRATANEMRRLCNSRSFDGPTFNDLDQKFHEQIMTASGNEFLLQAYKTLNVHAQIARLFQQRAVVHGKMAAEEHMIMLDALGRGDTEMASEALRLHLRNGSERLRRLLQEPVPESDASGKASVSA